jgi:hypothetical protein
MSEQLKQLIDLGLEYGLDVSNLTEQQAQDIIDLSEEWKSLFDENN